MMSNGMLIERDLLGVDRPRIANRGYAVAPCDLYEVADGWLLLQVVGQPMFKRWCRIVGREELFDDPRFASDDLRAEHGDILNDLMQEWCVGKTRAEAHGVASTQQSSRRRRWRRPSEVLDDPHVEAMGYLQRVPFPGAAHARADHRDPLPHVEDAGSHPHRARRCSVSTPTRS